MQDIVLRDLERAIKSRSPRAVQWLERQRGLA